MQNEKRKMQKKRKLFYALRFSLFVLFCCFSLFAFRFSLVSAYTLLEPLPDLGKTIPETGGLAAYLSWLYKFALAAAAVLAVLMIVIGGIQIIVGGAIEKHHTEGREKIWNAIWGLLLAISSYLILWTINPDLVKNTLTVPSIKIKMAPAPAVPSGDLGGDWTYDSGIENQLSDASDALLYILSCMRSELPKGIGRISSISDSGIITGNCDISDPNEKYKDDNNCVHSKNSCHYGGGIDNKSRAVDLGDEEHAAAIEFAALKCGAKRVFNEGDHLHVSIYSCSGN
jgi:hypothetical protein